MTIEEKGPENVAAQTSIETQAAKEQTSYVLVDPRVWGIGDSHGIPMVPRRFWDEHASPDAKYCGEVEGIEIGDLGVGGFYDYYRRLAYLPLNPIGGIGYPVEEDHQGTFSDKEEGLIKRINDQLAEWGYGLLVKRINSVRAKLGYERIARIPPYLDQFRGDSRGILEGYRTVKASIYLVRFRLVEPAVPRIRWLESPDPKTPVYDPREFGINRTYGLIVDPREEGFEYLDRGDHGAILTPRVQGRYIQEYDILVGNTNSCVPSRDLIREVDIKKIGIVTTTCNIICTNPVPREAEPPNLYNRESPAGGYIPALVLYDRLPAHLLKD